MALEEYLSGLDMSALPETLVDDIMRESAADAQIHIDKINELTAQQQVTNDELAAANATIAELREQNAELNERLPQGDDTGLVEDPTEVTMDDIINGIKEMR